MIRRISGRPFAPVALCLALFPRASSASEEPVAERTRVRGPLPTSSTRRRERARSSTRQAAPPRAATGSLLVALTLLRFVALELMGSAGYAPRGRHLARRACGSVSRWGRVSRDSRSPSALRPYGAVRFVHIHYATAETWKDHPADSFLGSSAAGLQHRSGMAGAAGLSWLIPHTDGKLRAMVEAELSWVPIGTPPAWALTSEVGLGYAF